MKPARHEHGKYHNYKKQPRDRFRALLQQFSDKRDRYQAQRPRHQPQSLYPSPKNRDQRYRDEDQITGPKNVVKSLLNLRNSLSCTSRDQCKKRCVKNALLQRSQQSVGKCVRVCEVTFTCVPAEQVQQDECQNSADCELADSCAGDDDCGTNEVNPSTRAPPNFDSCNPSDEDC